MTNVCRTICQFFSLNVEKKGTFYKIIYLEDLGTGGANAEEVYEEEPNITMSDLKNLLFIRSRRNSTLHENQDTISFFLFKRLQPTNFFSTCRSDQTVG